MPAFLAGEFMAILSPGFGRLIPGIGRCFMASPFPGMDLYLEHPAIWPGVHQGMISLIWMELNTMLPPRYVANMGERLYIAETQRPIYPDTVLIKRPDPVETRDGAVATLDCDPPLLVATATEEIREVFVEIRTAGSMGQVVTLVEVLSPINKAAGSEGNALYRQKQAEVLGSAVHLLEIDLLRHGDHAVAAPQAAFLDKGPWDYLVSLHRGKEGKRYQVWPITIRQRLPRVLVPLGEGDGDLVLDLQKLFERCYEVGGFGKRIDYRQPCQPPLEGERAEWVDALLKEKKLR